MMQERGLLVDHTTVYRWVQAYAPEIESRCIVKDKSRELKKQTSLLK